MSNIDAEVVDLGASKLDDDTGVPLYQGKGCAFSDDPNDAPSFDDTPVMCQLGVTALPYPADSGGNAEGLVCKGIAGYDGIVVGARDTRSNSVVGKMKAGDTVVHSTGPEQAAQLQLKEEKRQCALVTKGSNGKTMGLFLDGEKDQGMMTVGGCVIEISDGGISMTDKTGKAGIIIKNGVVAILGQIILGGKVPSIPMAAVAAAPAAVPCPNVFAGIPLP